MNMIWLVLAALGVGGVIVLVMLSRLQQLISGLQAGISKTQEALAAQDGRMTALCALVAGHSGLPESAPGLVSCLNSPDALVRQAAVETLGHLGRPALAPLLSALKHEKIPSSVGVEVVKRLEGHIDLESFLSLPSALQGQFLPVLKRTSLGSDELLRLCGSDSPELLSFVLSHEHTDAAVVQAVAKKGGLSSAFQEMLARHRFADESIFVLLTSTDALGAVLADESLPETLKTAARNRVQAIIEQRRKEQEAAEAQAQDYGRSEDEPEDYGRGRNCTGCGGC